MLYDPQKTTWLNPNIEYLFNSEIIEYDIRDAGFNLIKQYKLLPADKIQELEKLGKGFERHKRIGIMQRNDREFSTALLSKFAEIRTVFINMNNITDNDIVSVKKDAIFIIGQVKQTKFGGIEFAQKNVYSSYIRFPNIQNMEIYYSNMGLEIKGMSEIAMNKHRLYMLDFLYRTIGLIEIHSTRVKRNTIKFIEEYKRGELEDGYYLEFNNMSREINPLFNYQNILVPLVQIIQKEVK